MSNDDRAKKVEHVKTAKQTRHHACHWPDCRAQVPPAMWGCKRHWFMLLKSLRDKIWKTYQPGQEIAGNPSKEYLLAAEEVQSWIWDFEVENGKQ